MWLQIFPLQGIMLAILSGMLVVTYIGNGSQGEEDPLAVTPLGKLKGYWMTSRSGRKFQAYSGVPYAQPPVGSLRFQAPLPMKPWKNIRDAKENGPFCIQMNMYQLKPRVIGVEDCLYLSLYTHNLKGKVPVIVHFHGGGFVSGNGARRNQPNWFMDEDVVVVDVNYRLGIMGFLSFEDRHMPGNQAMKDQVMALRWVKENIASFGGDPNCVTIVGESAGAQSVYHHTVSPLSRGLFHRAISESGSSYMVGSLMAPGYVRQLSYKLAKLTNCSRENESTTVPQMVACLQKLDANEVAGQLVKFREWQIDPLNAFKIVFEKGPDAFLTCPLSEWSHAKVPMLLGTTSAEGILRAAYFIYYNTSWEWLNDNFEKVAPLSIGFFHALNPAKHEEVSREIRKFYFPKENIIDNGWDKIVQVYSDGMYIMGIIEGANKHSLTEDTYFYYFDYLGDNTLAGNINRSLLPGAAHTEETIYLWNLPSLPELSEKERGLSEKLVKMWTNFAKYGNPTPSGSDFTWKRWKTNENRYLHISNSGFKMEKDLAPSRQKFWDSLDYRDQMNKCL